MKTLIKFHNDYIEFFDYNDYKIAELNRTNVLDLHEIVLSDSFISENYNFIYNFIKNKIMKDHITKVFIDKENIDKIVFKIIKNIDTINYIYINEEKKIDIELFNYILNNKNIKTINCYDINIITFERLNMSRKINIITRKKYCDNTYIYRINNMSTYSDVFYKEKIIIDKLLKKNELNKLNEFLNINKYLKRIEIKYFDKNNLMKILSLLNNNNIKNIRIDIIENDSNVKDILKYINYIKKKNKFIRKKKITIKINYEEKYIKKNIFKQLNLNFIRTILIIVILSTSAIYGLFYIINEQNVKNSLETTKRINEIISNIKIEEPKKEPEQPKVEEIKTEKPKQESAYFKSYSKAISELKKINSDTVGWLSLNNSKINYPVVQANDNEKYLDYSFDLTKNLNGWIFLDYRNNPNDLDKNSIIYGHSGNYYVMFGSLKNVLNKNWYTNSSNQIITFNTETNSKKWQIFSIYVIETTNDYIQTEFENDEEYQNFLNTMKSRSIYDFGQNLSVNDKILTLSTCYDTSNKRLVIQAKLLQ